MATLKLKTIKDTGIVEVGNNNNAHTQTILLTHGTILYKIDIRVESYDFQSYARLYTMGADRKWTMLDKVIPKDYGIKNFYSPYSQTMYVPMINDLKKVMKALTPSLMASTQSVEA